MTVTPLPALHCPVCDDRMPLEINDADRIASNSGERVCSEECRKDYNRYEDKAEEGYMERTPAKHHDECNCYTCHARWQKELNT